MKCSQCGAEIDANKKFCTSCSLPASVDLINQVNINKSFLFCTECGTKNDEGSRFCSDCGFKLGDYSEQLSEPFLNSPTSANTKSRQFQSAHGVELASNLKVSPLPHLTKKDLISDKTVGVRAENRSKPIPIDSKMEGMLNSMTFDHQGSGNISMKLRFKVCIGIVALIVVSLFFIWSSIGSENSAKNSMRQGAANKSASVSQSQSQPTVASSQATDIFLNIPGTSQPNSTPIPEAMNFGNPKAGKLLVELVINGDLERFKIVSEELQSRPKPPAIDRKQARILNDQAINALKSQNGGGRAIELLRKAIELDNSDAEIADNLGYALRKAGHHEDSSSQLLKVLERWPQRGSAWVNFAETNSYLGNSDVAIASYVMGFQLAKYPQKTLENLQKISESAEDQKIRDDINSAISKINKLR